MAVQPDKLFDLFVLCEQEIIERGIILVEIRAMTKFGFNHSYNFGPYLETPENSYPRPHFSPIIDRISTIKELSDVSGIFYICKWHKFVITFENLPRGAKVIARLHWNKKTSNNKKHTRKLVSLSNHDKNTVNIDEIYVHQMTNDNKSICTFYLIKNTRTFSNRRCFLHICVEINEILIMLAKYLIVSYGANYAAHKNTTKFVTSAPSVIKKFTFCVP